MFPRFENTGESRGDDLFLQKVKRAIAYCGSFQLSIYSANAAFFLLLSLLPVLILLLSFISISPLTETDLLHVLERLIPETFIPLFQYLIHTLHTSQSVSFLSITTVTLLWAASRGTLGLISGLNAIYHVEEHRNYLWRRIISIGHTLLIAIALLVMLVLYVFSDSLLSLLTRLGIDMVGLFPLVLSLRHVFSMALLILFFTMLFSILPNRHLPIKNTLPGAIFSAVAWLGLSYGFSFYVKYISRYTDLYGSLGTLLLALLWLYLCMNILFYGGILNYYTLSRQEREHP
jgi:membrane protein